MISITRKDALDFLNNSVEYADILEKGEKLFKIKLENLSDFADFQLACLCEDFGYSEDWEEIEILEQIEVKRNSIDNTKNAIQDFLFEIEYKYDNIFDIVIRKREDNEWGDNKEFPYEILDWWEQADVIWEETYKELLKAINY